MQKTQKKRTRRTRRMILLLAAVILAAVGIVMVQSHRTPGVPDNALGLDNCLIDAQYLDRTGNYYAYSDTARHLTGVAGVDVSVHQGAIDWDAVAASGVDFAMIRLGYRGYATGNLALDETFYENVAGASRAGLNIGVYFYSQAVTAAEAAEEARFVLDTLAALDGVEIRYPIVYDQETYTADAARTDALSGEQATDNALAFCAAVEDAGKLPMIYMNNDWALRMYDLTRLRRYLIWYADYNEMPSPAGGCAMWQYTDSGTVPGTESQYIDLNLLFLPTR